jgi:signal transduction histidine kinase
MQQFRNMTINRKVTLVILLTAATALLLAGAAMIAAEVVTSRHTMVEDLTISADLLARNCAAPLSFGRDEDVEEVDKALSALAADPHVILACVFDNDGKLFGKYIRPGDAGDAASAFPSRPPADGCRFVTGYVEAAHPVVSAGSSRVGTIYVRADLGRMHRQVALHAVIVGLILLLTIVITLAVVPRLRRPISGPILALADVARRVSQAKDYSARAPKQGADEVGLLTDAFNQMLDEIDASQTSLRQANRSMQAEIVERTAVEARLRQATADLSAAKETAESANRAKDEFLAVLSHELRTPLTPVLMATSLLREYDHLPQDVRDEIQTIHRNVELEARLIDDLLDLTRITRGKLTLARETTDAHALVRDAVRICCAGRMDDVTLALDAPRHHVDADPGRLLQVFWNILNNARKFTPPGRPISVRTSNPGDNGAFRLEVADRGVGIDPALLPCIFNAFEQGDASFTRQFGGLGLGLAIARALVGAHGGSIRADSQGPGTGATFTVDLATVAPPAPAATPDAPSSSGTPAAAPPPPAAPIRLLLVEDHPGTLKLMTRLLAASGYDVRPADTVKSALAIADQSPIDFVVSDLGLPDGTGLDLMRLLRDRHGLRGICLTGFGTEEDIARSKEAGFCQHLTKPVDFRTLDAAIRQAVNGNLCP